MLKALAQYLGEHKKEFYELSTQTGATKKDSWVDIDGGISTLFVFSSKGRREMPNDQVYVDGRRSSFHATALSPRQHIYTPMRGAAVHINAYKLSLLGNAGKARTDASCRNACHRKTGNEYLVSD